MPCHLSIRAEMIWDGGWLDMGVMLELPKKRYARERCSRKWGVDLVR